MLDERLESILIDTERLRELGRIRRDLKDAHKMLNGPLHYKEEAIYVRSLIKEVGVEIVNEVRSLMERGSL